MYCQHLLIHCTQGYTVRILLEAELFLSRLPAACAWVSLAGLLCIYTQVETAGRVRLIVTSKLLDHFIAVRRIA
jgi:hypothetical protein